MKSKSSNRKKYNSLWVYMKSGMVCMTEKKSETADFYKEITLKHNNKCV